MDDGDGDEFTVRVSSLVLLRHWLWNQADAAGAWEKVSTPHKERGGGEGLYEHSGTQWHSDAVEAWDKVSNTRRGEARGTRGTEPRKRR